MHLQSDIGTIDQLYQWAVASGSDKVVRIIERSEESGCELRDQELTDKARQLGFFDDIESTLEGFSQKAEAAKELRSDVSEMFCISGLDSPLKHFLELPKEQQERFLKQAIDILDTL